MTSLQDNKAFSKLTPNLQIAWDNTCISALKSCPRYYQQRHILGYQEPIESVHLIFGRLIHSALEFADKIKALEPSLSHEDLVSRTVAHALEISGIAGLLEDGTATYIGYVAPDDMKAKSRPNLIRAVVWYLDHYKDDPAKTYILPAGKPAVELSFRFSTKRKSQAGEEFLVCGHIDKIVWFGGAYYILDRKSTKNTLNERYFSNFTPDNQMTLYCLGAKVTTPIHVHGAIIDGIQCLVTGNRFIRHAIPRNETILEEWLNDAVVWMRLAEQFALQDYWPMNQQSCDKYAGCTFRSICSKAPDARQNFLDKQFIIKHWDPLETR